MKVSIIVAMDRCGVIGANGRLPWHLPADLKHFKSVTMGKPIVMGRKTHASIGRPLPGRENIVLTRNPGYLAVGCTVLRSVDAVLVHCGAADEIMIMGGAEIYAQFLPRAARIYLTWIDAELDGDTRFPRWEDLTGPAWHETGRQNFAAGAGNPWPFSFSVIERVTAHQDSPIQCA